MYEKDSGSATSVSDPSLSTLPTFTETAEASEDSETDASGVKTSKSYSDERRDARLRDQKEKGTLPNSLTVDEAALRIQTLIPVAKTAQRQYMDAIWQWGEIVAAVEKPWGERVKIYQELNDKTGIHFNMLRQYEALYDQFLGKKESFDKFIETYENKNQLRLNFTNVSAVLKLIDKVEPEFANDIAARQVEAAVRKVAELNEKAQENTEAKRISESVSKALDQELEVMHRSIADGTALAPTHIPRSEKYLNFVRKHPCILSGMCDCAAKSDVTHAHHTQMGGRGIVGSDYSTIPLCPESHDFWHNHGQEAWEGHYGVDTPMAVAEMLHRYNTARPLYF